MTSPKAAAPCVADSGWRRNARLGIRAALSKLPPNVADFIYRQIKGTVKRIGVPPNSQITKLHGNVRLSLDLTDGMQRNMYYLGFLEPRYVACLARYVHPGDIFVDVRANVGYYTLWAAQRVGDKGYVYGFEPNPVAFNHMAANVEMNGLNNITLYNVALGDRHSTGCLKLCLGQLGGSRLIATQSLAAGQTVDDDLVSVPIEPLNNYLESLPPDRQIDVMKIDAEGAETSILHGADKLLTGSDRPYLLVEVDDRLLKRLGSSAQELLEYLNGLGYQPFAVARDGSAKPYSLARLLAKIPSHTNLLFVPDGKPTL